MSYVIQDFKVGQKLTAAALNRMDKQIALNAEGIASFNRQMVVNELEKLSLETDGQYIILKFGDVVIGEVAIADVANVIACTDLVVTSSGEVSVDVSETSDITCAIQPDDCNQVIRYRSDDLSIASVDSSGKITGIGAGVCKINILCGSHRGSVIATVSEIVKPTWIAGNYIYVESTDKGNNSCSKLEMDPCKRAYVFPQDGTSNIFVKAGQTVTVSYNGAKDYYFMHAYAIAPATSDGFAYTEDWSGRVCVANRNVVADIFGDTSSHSGPIVYTATEDCYLIFGFYSADAGDEYTDEQLTALNEGLITVRISPN